MATHTAAYPLARSFRASARLNLQHFLHKKDLGWLIHPSIQLKGPDVKIADIGAGTGLWLVDLVPEVPASSKLEGFDISDEQYPHSAWLPPNVKLAVQDIFGPVPDELIGRYDFINIRFFTCVVRDNDPSTVIQNVFKMLKPGGWLQWTDYDGLHNHNETAPGVSEEVWQMLKREVEIALKSSPTRFAWLEDMTSSLQKEGFVNVSKERKEASRDTVSAWQQSNLMVAEEMSYAHPESGEKIRSYVARNQLETPKGVYWNRPHVIFLAQRS